MLRQLLAVGLPKGDFALFGSGPLLVRGWIDDPGDLDIIARGPAWDHAQRRGQLRRLEDHGIEVVLIGDHITVGTTRSYGDFSVDALIDEAELIQDIPYVRLQHVIVYKRVAERPRDRVHLALIEEHLARGER